MQKIADLDKQTGRVSIGVGIEAGKVKIEFPTPQKKVYLSKSGAIEIAQMMIMFAEKLP